MQPPMQSHDRPHDRREDHSGLAVQAQSIRATRLANALRGSVERHVNISHVNISQVNIRQINIRQIGIDTSAASITNAGIGNAGAATVGIPTVRIARLAAGSRPAAFAFDGLP